MNQYEAMREALLKAKEALCEALGNDCPEIVEKVINPILEMKRTTDDHDNMRQALESLLTGVETFVADLEFDLDGHYPEGYHQLLNDLNRKMNVARTALLSKPRNCDVYRTRKEAEAGYDKYAKWNMVDHFNRNDFKSSCMDYEDWFFADYDPKYENYLNPESVARG